MSDADNQPVFSIEKLYVKDISLEIPNAPQVLLVREAPQVEIQLHHESKPVDDGVYQLKRGMQTKGIETKNFSPTYRALDGYDVEKLYVERESLQARGLTEEDLLVDVTVLDRDELSALMQEQDVVLSF